MNPINLEPLELIEGSRLETAILRLRGAEKFEPPHYKYRMIKMYISIILFSVTFMIMCGLNLPIQIDIAMVVITLTGVLIQSRLKDDRPTQFISEEGSSSNEYPDELYPQVILMAYKILDDPRRPLVHILDVAMTTWNKLIPLMEDLADALGDNMVADHEEADARALLREATDVRGEIHRLIQPTDHRLKSDGSFGDHQPYVGNLFVTQPGQIKVLKQAIADLKEIERKVHEHKKLISSYYSEKLSVTSVTDVRQRIQQEKSKASE